MDLHAREQGGLYDDTLNTQRETFYEIRDKVLDPEVDLRHKLMADSKEFLSERITEELGPKKAHSYSDIQTSLKKLSNELKTPVTWSHERGAKTTEVIQSVESQITEQLHSAFSEFDHSEVKLDEVYRQALLGTFDQEWSNHLETMASIKQGVQWVSNLGEKPEDAYKERGLEAFKGTLKQIRNRAVIENLGQIVVGASILKSKREREES